jgi:hypothetical protein
MRFIRCVWKVIYPKITLETPISKQLTDYPLFSQVLYQLSYLGGQDDCNGGRVGSQASIRELPLDAICSISLSQFMS